MSKIKYSKVIADIYDASVAPKNWNNCAKSMAEYIGGDTSNLFFMNTTSMAVTEMGYHGIDMDVFWPLYEQHFVHLDPWNYPLSTIPAGKVATGSSLGIEMNAFVKTEYYNDFWGKAGLHHTSGARLELNNCICVLGVHRSKGKEPFSSEQIAKFQPLTSHIQRSASLYIDYLDGHNQTDQVNEIFTRAEVGVIALDDQSRVCDINSIAENILSREDGIIIRDNKIEAITPKENLLLQSELWHPFFLQHHHQQPTIIYISRKNNITSYALNIIPAIQNQTIIKLSSAATHYLFIIDPDHSSNYSLKHFSGYYKLTTTEESILELLTQGLSVADISENMHTSKDTTRSHLKSCFLKTFTHSQSELVAKALNECLGF